MRGRRRGRDRDSFLAETMGHRMQRKNRTMYAGDPKLWYPATDMRTTEMVIRGTGHESNSLYSQNLCAGVYLNVALFADTESREDHSQQIIRCELAGNAAQTLLRQS